MDKDTETKAIGRKGTLGLENGKYYVELPTKGAKAERVYLGSMVDQEKLKAVVGKQVEVITSQPQTSVIAIDTVFGPQCYMIICYVPPEPWSEIMNPTIPVVDRGVRVQMADQLLKEGVISQEAHARILRF